jgi:putative transposase
MPYRKQQFINNEIYHIVTRGIDNNLLFKNKDDYYRGIFSIYEFNTQRPTEIRKCREARAKIKKALKESGGERVSAELLIDERNKWVEILSFCFMPNHIHLLLKQIKSNGITKFISKVGIGYAGYFNRKYKRKGYVFQNRFSEVHIKNNNQLKNVFVYIHTNPLSLIEPKWKEKGIKNSKKAIKFLENYKWSSYSDYLGKDNFPSVTDRDFMLKVMGDSEDCKEFVDGWVKYKKGEIKGFEEIVLE